MTNALSDAASRTAFRRKYNGMHRTVWFDGKKFVPGAPGVYEKDCDGLVWPSLWDGEKWCVCCATVEAAATQVRRSIYEDAPWRGLAKKPSS
jgi:hypothetical protein